VYRTIMWVTGMVLLVWVTGESSTYYGLPVQHARSHMLLDGDPGAAGRRRPVTLAARAIRKRDDGTRGGGNGFCGPCTRPLPVC
jgi:putative copper resistance protein D